ncbi:MAG: hypothetical protein N2050_02830 [Flavobacteriales bacterium]|nr:hypothetical protein [Flavobacteriales bacterium]
MSFTSSFFSFLKWAGICLILPWITKPLALCAQAPDLSTFHKIQVLVKNMTEKNQFYETEKELQHIPGFVKLDCQDFPPQYLIVYSQSPLDKSNIKKAFEKAGIEVFEICENERELESAIYRFQYSDHK